MASVKLNRAIKAADKLPAAEAEILSSIPDELLAQLTSKQITLVMNALDAHWHKAVRYCTKEILEEGCVWDGHELREIARKMSSARKSHKGGRPHSDSPRCPCGAMTLTRAKARGHKCLPLIEP